VGWIVAARATLIFRIRSNLEVAMSAYDMADSSICALPARFVRSADPPMSRLTLRSFACLLELRDRLGAGNWLRASWMRLSFCADMATPGRVRPSPQNSRL
jgi:hypothetical protein